MLGLLLAAGMVASTPIEKVDEICGSVISSDVGQNFTQGLGNPFPAASPEGIQFTAWQYSRVRAAWTARASQDGLDPVLVNVICNSKLQSYMEGIRSQLKYVEVKTPRR